MCPGQNFDQVCWVRDMILIQLVNGGDVTFRAAHQALKALLELFQTAIDEMLSSLGWTFVINAEDFSADDMKCLRLMRKSGALAMLHEDMVYCLALQLFLTRIRG